MPLELIYTSAPRGLRAGSSGYCTVAQTRGMREDLSAALERRSLYAHEPSGPSPVYFSFRPISLGGGSWRVLSRALDAGLDFTGRRHYLVHHLAWDVAEEPAGTQPAEILLGWQGWRQKWEGPPQELEARWPERWWQDLPRIRPPFQEWKRQTNDAGWAAFPHQLASPVGWLSADLRSEVILRLMGESAALREEGQNGWSWLVYFDVGGAANPVPQECQWAGRSPWKSGSSPHGVRSALRIEECRGKPPRGRAEEVELARTGREGIAGRPRRPESIQSTPATPAVLVAAGSFEPEKRRSGFRPWTAGGLLMGLGLAVGGFWFWWFAPPPSALPTSPISETKPASPGATFDPLPGPVRLTETPASPGQSLQRALWSEAGGQEPIEVLHILFGRPASVGLLEDELDLVLQGLASSGVMRAPEGWSRPVALQGMKNREAFCREAARKTAAWALFVPEASRGLAYLPDPFRDGLLRKIPAQGRPPREILAELGRRIFLEPQRWSLVVFFPPWEGDAFTPVRIGPDDTDSLWLDRLDRHRAQMRQLRNQAMRSLTPWLGEDPERWDERKIRMLAAQMKGGKFPEIFGQFTKLDEEYRRWWLPPISDERPAQIFSRLLEHPGLRCELQLDDKLVIGRLVP